MLSNLYHFELEDWSGGGVGVLHVGHQVQSSWEWVSYLQSLSPEVLSSTSGAGGIDRPNDWPMILLI